MRIAVNSGLILENTIKLHSPVLADWFADAGDKLRPRYPAGHDDRIAGWSQSFTLFRLAAMLALAFHRKRPKVC